MKTKQKEIIQKQELLQRAKVTLKSEFIGLDQVIDDVVDSISSWYLFPDLQEKPVVVNLWGLTGVGKSSLVKRLVELIDFENRFYSFDLGEEEGSDWSIKSQLQEIYSNINSYPIILALDEFQHARSIDEAGNEKEKKASAIVWQLLDTGKFQISRASFSNERIYNLILKLSYLMNNKVEVKNGKVVSRKKYFIEKMDLQDDFKEVFHSSVKMAKAKVLFVPDIYYGYIFSMAKEEFCSIFDVKTKLERLNAVETIDYLYKILALANSAKTVDCSKGLIFVLGNLDEAYSMSNDYDPDMEADEFHEQSLRISISTIKKALKNRFRNEQIARLGNNHVIYPAFSKKSFQDLIALELSKIAAKVEKSQNIKIGFADSIHQLIFKEGVYPSQGTRPILTTIHQIISTKMGKIFSEMLLNKIMADKIILHFKNEDSIIAEYFKEEKIIHSFSMPQQLNLEKLRKSKCDDRQAITAVHEAGHAVVACILLHTLPETICSNSTDDEKGGFVYAKFKWEYVSKKETLKRIALFLAGLIAEKLVYGEENMTTGSGDDIRRATMFTCETLKKHGFGKIPAAYHVRDTQTNHYLFDDSNQLSEEARNLLEQGSLLAEETLIKQKKLLLRIADYLSDHRQMGKEQIREMLNKYAVDFSADSIIENGDLLYYRTQLIKELAMINGSISKNTVLDAKGFSLNRGK